MENEVTETNEVKEVIEEETQETHAAQEEITENPTENTEVNETKPEKTFTQKELDELVTKRIERERETVRKKAAQEARDAYIAEQNWEWNGKHIKTEAEYKEALKEQELREKYRELPEEVQQELIESKKFREAYAKQQEESEKQAKQQADYQLFLKLFPDVDAKDIPESVWVEVDQGISLVDAYTRHENQTLKERLAKLTKAKEADELNDQNAQSTTGSVTGQGGVEAAFISQDVFEKNRNNSEWVKKNFEKIMESRAKW